MVTNTTNSTRFSTKFSVRIGLSALLAAMAVQTNTGCKSRAFNDNNDGAESQEIVSSTPKESYLQEKHAVRVNLETNMATYYKYGAPIKSWKIASGKTDGKSDTPLGTFRFHELSVCQEWKGTRTAASYGACDPGNPTGSRGLWFKGTQYGLHGIGNSKDAHESVTIDDVNKRRASLGCVRNHPDDIKWLTEQVAEEYGTTPDELNRIERSKTQDLIPAAGKGVAVIIGRWDASADAGSTSGGDPKCTKENANARVASDKVIEVSNEAGTVFDGQPWEEVCTTDKTKNGKVQLFFPNPPAGYAYADKTDIRTCNVTALQTCIKNKGGAIPCAKRECKTPL